MHPRRTTRWVVHPTVVLTLTDPGLGGRIVTEPSRNGHQNVITGGQAPRVVGIRRPKHQDGGTTMRRGILAIASALLAVSATAGPVGAKDFGAVFVNDSVYRVFANRANVP